MRKEQSFRAAEGPIPREGPYSPGLFPQLELCPQLSPAPRRPPRRSPGARLVSLPPQPRALGYGKDVSKLSPPSLSTKPEARKDKNVVEVKSDKLSEEAGLLQGANGEKRSAADQVGPSIVCWGQGCAAAGQQPEVLQVTLSRLAALPTLHGPPSSISSARGRAGRKGKGWMCCC